LVQRGRRLVVIQHHVEPSCPSTPRVPVQDKQQYAQQQLNTTPVYELLDEKGPDHDKCFESQVVVADRHFPSAWGRSKKEAEQKAAFNALIELGILNGDLPNLNNGRR